MILLKCFNRPAVVRSSMKSSGTRLVLGLACLALAAGVVSWLYRYGATHEATQFWGGEAAALIARPSEVEFFRLELADPAGDLSEDSAEATRLNLDLGRPYSATQVKEITKARGMVHFRHALMTDGNYRWDDRPKLSEVDWRWGMRFYDGQTQAVVVLSKNLDTLGLVVSGDSREVKVVSCQPMAETLEDYFFNVDITASTSE